MSETPIRFGILGRAKIARKVSRAMMLAPNATIHAISSRSIEKATKYASTISLPPTLKLYGSYEDVLDDPDVDAVYIPLPTSLHLKWTVMAAKKKKHVLLEKPVALNVAEFDAILEACESNNVQFMDGTMWMHHPRTFKMKEFLSGHSFGRLEFMYCSFTNKKDPNFLENNIRVKPDLDALGVLGDLGWYCIRAILWANGYQLPKTIVASRNPVINNAGVILSCGSSLYWDDGRVATFYCSFLTHMSMDMTALGSKGSLRVHDLFIPFEEHTANLYEISNQGHVDVSVACREQISSEQIVTTDSPQEALMVKEFANLVSRIKENGMKPETKWGKVSRMTQLVVDAVRESIERGFEPIEFLG